MAFLFRWLLRGFVVMFVLAGLAGLLVYYFAVRSLPDYNATYDVANISAPVEIVRDSNNVPHIFASSDRDVYYSLGFAHAQDRLWQMTMLRRTAQGRLSEIFGERTANLDEFIRRLELYGLAQGSYKYQTEATKDALNAYAQGVNAWLRTVNEQALGRGAPEFFLFSNSISPWIPADSLAIIRLMALKLDSNLKNEVLRAQVSLTIGGELLQDIMPDAPGTGLLSLPNYAQLFPNAKMQTQIAQNSYDPLDPLRPAGMGGASNAWAVSASRAAANAPILATDPHLGLTAPSIWMLARLEFQNGGVIGATIPGIPAILAGRSSDLAWGVTSSYMDNLDIYIEKLNPDNPDEYLTPDGYKPFRTKSVIITVKDGVSRTIKLRYTQNGPVIPNSFQDLGTITPQGHVTSLRWAALEVNDLSMSGAIELMHSKSILQARKAARKFTAPSQNLILADKNGIALQTIGKMPKRSPYHTSKGRIPSQGWLVQNRWQGYFDFADNPYINNPESGIVANTNNKLTDDPFPNHVSYLWGDTQRINRLTKLLNTRAVHTRESFVEAQNDTVSYTARSLLPLIARELWFTGAKAPAGTPERLQQTALELLASWNGEMDRNLPEPLIFAAWLRNLQSRLASDELGPLIQKFPRPNPTFIERVFRDIDGAAQWCDIRPSSRIETCTDIARMSLNDALLELSEQYGPHIESWRWGQAHMAYQDHKVLGKIPLISWFTNIRQETGGGDNTLQRASMSGTGKTPYANIHAAGFRAIVDFADPDSSVYIISTGQSGHPFSPHYDDLAQLWRRGEYIPMSLDPKLARGGAVGVTTLQPVTP
ncbi:MAG: penicillin acylase family protein [Amylibacter sp.]|nr:penicillin acylase family protein [Amylibacter sp.]